MSGRRRAGADTLKAPGALLGPLAPTLGVDRGRPAILVDGIVQSVAPPAARDGYWAAMLPEHPTRRALILGVGGGTFIHLLAARFGHVDIVGVDDDSRMLALARTAFGPLPAGTQLVAADALAFIRACPPRFDFVAVDLFRGAAVPRGVYSLPFLRGVRGALVPRGRAVFNLFQDRHTEQRVTRLATVLRLDRSVRVGSNVLVHCRTA